MDILQTLTNVAFLLVGYWQGKEMTNLLTTNMTLEEENEKLLEEINELKQQPYKPLHNINKDW